MQVSLGGGGKITRMRDFCHMADIPRVLFSFDDDLLGRIKNTSRDTEDAGAAYHCVKLRSKGERDLKQVEFKVMWYISD